MTMTSLALAGAIIIMGNSLSTPPDAWHTYVMPEAVNYSFGGFRPDHFLGNAFGWKNKAQPGDEYWLLLSTTGDPETYEDDLGCLVDEILALGGTVRIVHSPRSLWPPSNPKVRDLQEAELRICAVRSGVVCGPDLYWQLLDEPGNYVGLVHPSHIGQIFMGWAVWKATQR